MRLRRQVTRGARLPRFPLPRRWRDTTTMLLSNPVGRQKLLDAIAQLDRWAATLGEGPETLRVSHGRLGKRRTGRSVRVNRGFRRAMLPARWHDETAYLLRTPANAKWIRDSLVEVGRWRAHREAMTAGRRREADGSRG
jgi:hypothetical protein